jgi:hypothetical protein
MPDYGKRCLFETKVIVNGKAYLQASDCAKALGFKSNKAFCDEHADIVVKIGRFSELVAEEDYNRLLVNDRAAFAKQIHIEKTKVFSLNSDVSALARMYGLKIAFAHSQFMQKAREKGCESIEEYIERYDFPDELRRVLVDFDKKSYNTDSYDRSVTLLRDERVFNPKLLHKYGMKLQALTVIEDNSSLELQAFLVGKGFFYQLSMYDAYEEYYIDSDGNLVDTKEEADHIDAWYGEEKYADMYLNEKGELCIPVYDEDTGTSPITVIGKTTADRDFRDYTVFENLVWALQHTERNLEMVDAACYDAPGIKMYLKEAIVYSLVFPNNAENILVDGIIDYDVTVNTTLISDLPMFYFDQEA